MRAIILFVLVSTCLTAYTQKLSKIDSKFRKLDWLLGTWIRTNTTSGRSTYECWEKINDYELRGLGVNLKGTDTLFVERLKIIQRNDTIYYVADVPENNRLVYFKITTLSDEGFTCENPTHDFPKKITYLHDDGSLKAQISSDGKVIDYYFEQKK